MSPAYQSGDWSGKGPAHHGETQNIPSGQYTLFVQNKAQVSFFSCIKWH